VESTGKGLQACEIRDDATTLNNNLTGDLLKICRANRTGLFNWYEVAYRAADGTWEVYDNWITEDGLVLKPKDYVIGWVDVYNRVAAGEKLVTSYKTDWRMYTVSVDPVAKFYQKPVNYSNKKKVPTLTTLKNQV
jgi:hypothetical protein